MKDYAPSSAASLPTPAASGVEYDEVVRSEGYRFPKAEHLCLQRDIDALFAEGAHSRAAFPVRVVWREVDWMGGPRVKVLVSVSKRRFKHAVDRNRAKRQMREAYRLNKHVLDILPEGIGLHLGFIWLANKPQESLFVHKRIVSLLRGVQEETVKAHTNASVTE